MRKTLRFGLFSTVSAGVLAAVYLFNTTAQEAQYQPRLSDADSPHGYFEYLTMLKADPATGEVNMADVIDARNQIKNGSYKTSALGLSWVTKGPDNVGGRTRGFLVDKDNTSIMYMGSVSGGMFKSTTGGSSWTAIGDNLDNLVVSSICQTTSGDIYYSTGEAQYTLGTGASGNRNSAFIGGGIFKSTDGTNFTVLSSTVPLGPASDFGDVTWVKPHPTNGNTLWAATNRGVKRTDDGGQTWVDCIIPKSAVTDMTVGSDGSVWASLNGRCMYSADGSPNSFNEISKLIAGPTDLPRSPRRMRIEVAPSDPNYIYVTQIASNQYLSGIYRSTDRGLTWSQIGSHTNTWDPFGIHQAGSWSQGQGTYDLSMAVDPLDKNHLYAGGIDVWSWTNVGGWQVFTSAYMPVFNYTHADNHHIVFDKVNPTKMYILSDGGLFTTTNRLTFTEKNKNYNTIQFYGIGVGKHRELIGGSQDQRTQYNDGTGNTPEASVQVLGGDGGFSEISWLNKNVLMAENPNGEIRRTNNMGQSWDLMPNAEMRSLNAAFIAPYQLHETTKDVLSVDSVNFIALPSVRSLGFGNGILDTFANNLPRQQASAQFLTETFIIVAGGDSILSDAQGNLYGSGTGTFDPVTGDYFVQFTNAPVAEIVVTCQVKYDMGALVTARSMTNSLNYNHILTQNLNPMDTERIQDPVQAFVIAGFNGSVWMARNVLDFSENVKWKRIGNINGQPISVKISDNGEEAYVGTSFGNAYRFSNLKMERYFDETDTLRFDSVMTITTKLAGNLFGGRSVTDFAIDPNNPNRLVVCLGNYGQNNHVYYSSNALSTSPTFTSMQKDLPDMPVYSATFDKMNSQRMILGTEYGIYGSDNFGNATTSWSEENNGFARVPVFYLEQYRIDEDSYTVDCKDTIIGGNTITVCDTVTVFEGDIFLGAHGRGWYRSSDFMVEKPIGINENENDINKEISKKSTLKMYPNPASSFTNIEVDLNSSQDVNIQVLDINGRIVKSMKIKNLAKGKHDLRMELSGVASGTYVMSLHANGTIKSSNFIVTK